MSDHPLPQPYAYRYRALVEPDWTRFPAGPASRTAEWADAQWQRAHCVKNVKQLREVMGDLLEERFYADLERDQAERATMSMLVPPQMVNTMVPDSHDAGAPTPAAVHRRVLRRPGPPLHAAGVQRPPHRLGVAPVRHPRLAARARHVGGRGPTHRYPTKVLAELLPTCPQYCGHCTRMDLVGNSTPVIEKLKFDLQAGRPARRDDRLPAPYAAACATSSSPAATSRTCRGRTLEAFVARLLEIENIRDIRLATKALMGLPQHWLQDEVRRRGGAADRQGARARGPDRDPHPRQPRATR